MVHISPYQVAKSLICPSQIAQIVTLQSDKAFTKVSAKYADYADLLLFDLAMELTENTGINKHVIKLIKSK